MDDCLELLKIAKSNLKLGKIYSIGIDEDIRFEELCFELQQCVEKSLKALLIYHNIKFKKIYTILELLDLLVKNNIFLPDEILESVRLTQYTVETRDPDDFVKITEEEYKQAVKIADTVFNWIQEIIKLNEL